jgi:hypothetical protein
VAGIIISAVLLCIYILFLLWYIGNRRPLSKEEVDRFMAIMEKRAGDASSAAENALAALRKFALEDDGKQFFMVNLVKYNEAPRYQDGDRGLTSRKANLRYVRNTLPLLFIRACHPYGLFRPLINLRQADSYWDEVNVVRYRSRRDFLSMVTSDKWYAGFGDKQAALSENPNYPSRGFVVFPIVPVLVFMILLLADLIVMACLYFRSP